MSPTWPVIDVSWPVWPCLGLSCVQFGVILSQITAIKCFISRSDRGYHKKKWCHAPMQVYFLAFLTDFSSLKTIQNTSEKWVRLHVVLYMGHQLNEIHRKKCGALHLLVSRGDPCFISPATGWICRFEFASLAVSGAI